MMAAPSPAPPPTPSNVSTISSNFNGTSIAAGDYIWFNSVVSVSGLGSAAAKVYTQGGTIQFSANGTAYNLSVADTVILFSPSATSASTVFDAVNNQWNITVPLSFSGNVFLGGLAYPVSTALPGGINPVDWTETFYTDTTGVSLNWKWAAAVYTSFSLDNNTVGVKPIDGNTLNPYSNSDHAGTPENYKSYVVGGARGGGGSNWTGSYSGTASVVPAVVTNQPPVAVAGPNQTVFVGTTVQLDGTGSYDLDGNPITYSWSLVSVPTGSVASLSGANTALPTFVVDLPGSYTAQLIVNDGQVSSAPSQVVISTKNSPPVANAGPNQTVATGTTVQLDGSLSTDVDGNPLTYLWSFVSVPTGSLAALSNPAIVNPKFVTDKKGTYVVQLVVNDGFVDSTPAQVMISDTNSPPVANAGPDQSIIAGNLVTLDGSGSTDVDGDTLTYSWTLISTPVASTVILSNPTAVKPTFYADMIGVYVAQLIVNDGTVNSTAATVTITTGDTAPVANAGPAQSVALGTVVLLDGTGSSSATGKSLTYQWSLLSKPANSTAALASPTSAHPSFTADAAGNYVVQLIVSDGFLGNLPATVTISTINSVPVANAGPAQSVNVGAAVTLDGSGSSDADGDPLTYSWAILTQPAGGAAVLSNANAVKPSFVANVAGIYVAQLIVNDGKVNSLPATVTITVIQPNQAPVVSAGPDQVISLPATTVLLAGTVTDDGLPVGGALTIQWTQVSGPGAVTFSAPNQASTQVTLPAVIGIYVLQLTANDSLLSTSSTATITLTAPNQPPVVTVGPDQTIVYPANTVSLTGTVTDDGLPFGGSLLISWAKVTGPGTVTFANAASPTTTATFSISGNYVLQLSASDGQYTNSGSLQVTFNGPAGGGIRVNAGSDQVIGLPNAATLSGTATDSNPPPGSVLSVNWSVVSGPGTATFANAGFSATAVSFTDPGVYQLRLTATNGTFTASSDVKIYAGQVQCTLSNKGTDFWLMFISAEYKQVTTTPPRELDLYISSDVATSGNVSVPGQGFNQSFSVTPGQITTVALPQSVQVTSSDLVEGKGIHVTSQDPVAVYGLNFVPAATDGFLGLPTMTLGTTYINLSYVNSTNIVGQAFGTEFGFTATQDNTTVTVVPTSKAGARQARQSYTVVLNQGQTYQLRNDTDLTAYYTGTYSGPAIDLTGSIITSDKPIAVFGGHDCAFVPSGYAYCNHLVEQLTPTNLWGQHFVAYPIARDAYGDTYRFLGGTDNTHVQVNGQQVGLINRGEFYEMVSKTPVQVDADQPILMAEYSSSATFSGRGDVDPTMIVIPPFEQFGGSYTINAPTSNFPTNYLNVIAPTAAAQAGGVLLDGTAIPAAAFQPIGNSPFSGAQVSVATGAHTLTSALPFGTYAYGFNAYDNYGYSGGTCLAKGMQGTSVAATPKSSTNPITSQAKVTATVTDIGGSPVGGVGVTFKVAGVNSQSAFATTNASGVASYTYTSLATGSDLVTVSAATASDTAGITWVSNGPNQAPIVSAGPNQTIMQPASTVFLNGSVVDDGLPIGGSLTSAWTQLSGPAAVSFATPNQPQTSASFPVTGTYVLQLTASDSALAASASITVTVYPPNQAPVVNAGPDLTFIWFGSFAQAIPLAGSATDDGLPAGSTFSVNWRTASGPDSVTFSPVNAASSFATFKSPGTYVVQLSASDTQFTTSSYASIHALGPVTTSLPGNSYYTVPAMIGTGITLDPNILVGGQPPAPGIPLKIQWRLFAGPATGGTVAFGTPNAPLTTATFTAPGTYYIIVDTSDVNQPGSGRGNCCFLANVVAAGTPAPTVSLAAPLDGSEVTKPVSIIATVSDGSWTLEYALQDDLKPMNYLTLATGTGPITNAAIATLDPTLLRNGMYTIRLRSIGVSGLSASASSTISVTRNMKVGVFTLSFNDLTVPVAGIPIQIVRSYDSRDKAIGDFGLGWRLSLADVRVQKNRNLGLGWQETVTWSGNFPQYCLQPGSSGIVTVTFAGGKVYRFQAGSTPQCQQYGPITAPVLSFTQLPGEAGTAGATLTPADGGADLVDGSVPGPVNLLGYDGLPYNPTTYILKTLDGTFFTIDQKLGLTAVTDTNGNTLTIGPNGILSSAGKSVPFTRDTQGRITRITDPNGNTMLYSYDGSGNLVGFSDRQKNLTTYTYEPYTAYHNLIGIFAPNGQQVLTNAYDASGRLTTTKDAQWWTSVSFTPDIGNQKETVKDRNGNATTYVYDDNGNVTQVTDALGNVTSSTYDGNGHKLSETNALGKTTSYTYDGFDNRTSETDPLGHVTSYAYTSTGKLLSVTDPLGRTTSNTYDLNGNLLTTTDPLGKVTTNAYSAKGLLYQTRDPLGHVTTFGYDAYGNLTSQTDAAGTVSTYTYDANGNRLTQTVTRTVNGAPQTLTTSYAYDANGHLLQTTAPDGSATQTVYNNLGQRTATTDARGNQTSYQYDADARLIQTTYPNTGTEQASYDNNGNRTRFTNRDGTLTTYTYDALNRLTQTQTSTKITKTTYDAIGRVIATTDPLNHVTQYAYDDAGRRTTVIDALNQGTSFTYDAAGNQTAITDAASHVTTFSYDAANRRTQVGYPDGTFEATAYDALGRVASRTDAVGKTTQYGYDALGRLTSITDALGQVTSYSYDELGNRLTQTDVSNHMTSYQYDQRGRRTKRMLPLGQTESYSYDAAGNLVARTDFNGKTTTYAYDGMNELLAKTPDASFGAAAVTYTYSLGGQRRTMTDASGTTGYVYDGYGQLTQKGRPQGSLYYQYDVAGNLTVLSGPLAVYYGYDALNRLTTVYESNTGTTSYAYDAVGNLASVTYPNGVVHAYSYDQRNRLANLAVNKVAGTPAVSTPLLSYAYTLDASGHRTSVTELSGRTANYSYDNLYRLTSESIAADPAGNNGAVNYTYDLGGNRTQMTSTLAPVPAGLFYYDANDRLTTDAYDSNGNTTNSGGLGYVYDFENRLIQKGGLTIVYDGDGNRVSKTAAGATTTYLVDDRNPTGYAQVVAENPPTNNAMAYIYGLERISRRRVFYDTAKGWVNERIYFVYDGHGSVRALTDQTGAVTDTYDYDAFGNLIHSTGTTPNNYLFAGEQFDPDLGLYYNRARYLNVSTGRFWNMDTDEGDDTDPLSLHKYLYAEANPIDNVDPSGTQIDSIEAGMAMGMTLDALPQLNFNTILQNAPKQETLYVRAFAPWKTFGGGFSGDNRSFTTSRDKSLTSRITGMVTFLLPELTISLQTAYSDPSHHPALGTKTATPTISANATAEKLHIEIAGSNPLGRGTAPDIDVKLDMVVRTNHPNACYSGLLYGDAFPNVEVFVVNSKDQATMLDTFTTSGGRNSGPLVYLPGNNNRPMGAFYKCVPE